MDVRFSYEQRALRDAAARVVDALAPKSVDDLRDGERAAKLREAVEASGWLEFRRGVGRGEPLAGAVEAAIVAEQLGRALADTPFVGPTLAAELRRLSGAPADQDETVLLVDDLSTPAVASPHAAVSGTAIDARDMTVALALASADPDRPPEAEPDGPAENAWPTGPTGAGPAYRLVSVTLHDVTTGRDLTRSTAHLVEAPCTELVDSRLEADDLDRWTALGLALTCSDLVGVMRGAVELARSYAMVRKQFGVAIGSFQSVQHMLADAHVAAEGSSSITLHAAWAVDHLPPAEALAAAAAAKAYCSRAARAACETSIQVHGGIGNTWECLAHVYLRRALLSTQVLGGVGPNLARVMRHRGLDGGVHGLR